MNSCSRSNCLSPIKYVVLITIFSLASIIDSSSSEHRLWFQISPAGFEILKSTMSGHPNPDDVVQIVTQIIDSPNDFSGADVAFALRARGYAYVSLENYEKAIVDLESARDHAAMPESDKEDLSHNLDKLYDTLEKNYEHLPPNAG